MKKDYFEDIFGLDNDDALERYAKAINEQREKEAKQLALSINELKEKNEMFQVMQKDAIANKSTPMFAYSTAALMLIAHLDELHLDDYTSKYSIAEIQNVLSGKVDSPNLGRIRDILCATMLNPYDYIVPDGMSLDSWSIGDLLGAGIRMLGSKPHESADIFKKN